MLAVAMGCFLFESFSQRGAGAGGYTGIIRALCIYIHVYIHVYVCD